jgi:tetratricopeptide (TPR) repeat protein
VNIISPVAIEEEDVESPYEKLIREGDEAYKSQKYDSAIDSYTKAVVFNPADKITMLKIANIYKLLGNNAKAISFYDKIILLDRDCTDAYFNKGLVYANQKDYDEAIKCFEKVIELSPEYPYAYYSLGMSYELKDMPERAIEYYHLYTGIETDEKMIDMVNQRIKQLEANE